MILTASTRTFAPETELSGKGSCGRFCFFDSLSLTAPQFFSYVATVPDNCQAVGDLTAAYLNRRDVQEAIHAVGPNGGLPLQWTECTSVINYDITGQSLVPKYANFQKQKPGFKVLVYSGDIDIATVPFGKFWLGLTT